MNHFQKISELVLHSGRRLQNKYSSCILFWLTKHTNARSCQKVSFYIFVGSSNCKANTSANLTTWIVFSLLKSISLPYIVLHMSIAEGFIKSSSSVYGCFFWAIWRGTWWEHCVSKWHCSFDDFIDLFDSTVQQTIHISNSMPSVSLKVTPHFR